MKKRLTALYEGYARLKTALLLVAVALYFVVSAYSGGSPLGFVWFCIVVAVYVVLPGFLLLRLLGLDGRAPAGSSLNPAGGRPGGPGKVRRWLAGGNTLPQGFAGPVALMLGVGFFAALYCVCMRLGLLWLLRGLPPLLAGAFLALKWRDHLRRARLGGGPAGVKALRARLGAAYKAIQPHQWLLILLYAALLVLFTFYGAAKNGHPLAVGDVLPNQDLYWNAGNAASFTLAFPPLDIRYLGVRLHYHYLTELAAGALSIVSGLAPYDILAFYMQPLVLAALVLGLYRFGRLVFPGGQFKALLFTFSMFLFSCASLWKILPNGLSVFWNANIIHLVTNINSQATAIVVLCVFMGMWVQAARQRYRVGPVYAALTLCVYLLLCFAKGPLAGLVAVAAVLAVLVGLPFRRAGWRGLLLAGLLAGVFVLVYTTMFASGANDSMTLTAHGTLEKGYFYNILELVKQTNYEAWKLVLPLFWLLQSLLMLPAQFPLYLRGLAGDVRHFNKLSQERLFFNAMAVGGLAAYFLFNHPHMSQTYFLYAAIFFINLLAVDATDYLKLWWGKARRRTQTAAERLKKWFYRLLLAAVALLAAVGLATTGFLYVHMAGSGLNQLARNLGLQEKYPYELVLSAEDEAALLWLRDNTPKDAIFATNRIHTGGRREGISNVYSAISQRQAFMEGFQYAKTNMGVPVDDIVARQALNTALFSADTPLEEVEAICREEGIDYLVFCTQMNGVDATDSQLAGLEKVWDSPGVRIYRLPWAA